MARALVFTLLATTLFASVPQQSTAHRKKSTAASKAPAKTGKSLDAGAHTRTVALSRRTKSRAHRVRKPAAPAYQLHPDPARYTQIQQALADRGYFKGTPNGEWNDDSVDALKRFQTDQQLEPDGKINALSLTGLGLGPRHDGSTAGTVPLSATDSSITPEETFDPSGFPPPETPAPAPPPPPTQTH